MEKILSSQTKFGKKDILKIKINTKSRDDIPKILLVVQRIYKNKELSNQIFEVLNCLGSPITNPKKMWPYNGLMGDFCFCPTSNGIKM